MPPRRCPICDVNQDAHHHENGDEELPPPPPPPPFYDGVHPVLAQFMVDTTRHFTEAIAQISRPNERAEYPGCSICDFTSHHFWSFEGIEAPNVAEAWLTDIEVLFNFLGYSNEQRVQYIRLKLTGWKVVDLEESVAVRTSKRDSNHLGFVQDRIQQAILSPSSKTTESYWVPKFSQG
jgi:hypothetical protein